MLVPRATSVVVSAAFLLSCVVLLSRGGGDRSMGAYPARRLAKVGNAGCPGVGGGELVALGSPRHVPGTRSNIRGGLPKFPTQGLAVGF